MKLADFRKSIDTDHIDSCDCYTKPDGLISAVYFALRAGIGGNATHLSMHKF